METELPVGNVTSPATAPEVKQVAQREAVYNAIMEVLKDELRENVTVKSLLIVTADDTLGVKAAKKLKRKKVKEILVMGFEAKAIVLKTPKEGSALRTYCSGLVTHWLKHDPRFN